VCDEKLAPLIIRIYIASTLQLHHIHYESSFIIVHYFSLLKIFVI